MDGFKIPELLKFTVLPFRITARAWADEVFKGDLLRNPRLFLLGHSTLFPRECSYIIPVDTASLQHFVIPYVDEGTLDRLGEKLLNVLEEEMGDTEPFETWLPPKVLYRALADRRYLGELHSRAAVFLLDEGYTAPKDICVIQNSPTTFHIPLRFNNIIRDSFDAAMREIRGDKISISSSKCCASGTCCN